MSIQLTIISAIGLMAAIGSIVFFINTQKVRSTKKIGEFGFATTLDWDQSIKHDAVMYFVPVAILALPFIWDDVPTLIDFFQALVAFLIFLYLKKIYWEKI